MLRRVHFLAALISVFSEADQNFRSESAALNPLDQNAAEVDFVFQKPGPCMSSAMKHWATMLMLTGCAAVPTIKDERPPVPLEPVAVRPVFIPEKDELFPLIEVLRPLAEDQLSSMGHAISERGWPVEIQLRAPEMGLKDEHARVCVRLIGRVVRPQGRFASIDVPAESCREANVYNPITVRSIAAADIPNAPNGQLYVEALRLLLDSLSRQARVPAGTQRSP